MTGTKIRILDPDTVNQIAAGEVVERPASVVKELLENAIDAGAMSILVEVSSDLAGVTKIRVTDDGEGMTPEEAVLAFQPHATSKIRDIADLSFIRTLGFRGEALASIAAVAEVTLVTRPRDSGALAGTRVVVRGGEVVEKNEVGAPEGTTVIVEHLFYNTPARRKFLKSRNTELAHIYGVAESLALAHGEVAFRVVHNGRERMATQRSGGLLNTIAGLYGADLARALIPIEARTPPPPHQRLHIPSIREPGEPLRDQHQHQWQEHHRQADHRRRTGGLRYPPPEGPLPGGVPRPLA